MLTGKVTLNGNNYYIPLMPCVTSFASVPALEIPQSSTPVDLQPAVGDLIGQASNVVCVNQNYFFDFVPPAPMRWFLPLVNR